MLMNSQAFNQQKASHRRQMDIHQEDGNSNLDYSKIHRREIYLPIAMPSLPHSFISHVPLGELFLECKK
jgi:hypothetical protein